MAAGDGASYVSGEPVLDFRSPEGRTTDPRQRAGSGPDLVRLGRQPARAWLTDSAVHTVTGAEQRPFADAEYDQRLANVRERMSRTGLDALVVFRPSSIEYLCGYHTAETAPQPLLVTGSGLHLYIPDLELGRALAGSRVDTVAYCGYADALRGLELFIDHMTGVLPASARVGVELGHTSVPPEAVDLLRGKDFDVVHSGYLVERVRLRLSDAELRYVEHAAVSTQAGVEAALAEAGKPDATDSSVAAAIAAALFEHANSPSAWGPVVASGERAGIAHSSWINRPLRDGATFIEFAGAHDRYHAPVMRTFTRRPPDPKDSELAELATTALAAILDSARPGVECAQVAREAITALGPLPDDVLFSQLFAYPVGLAHKPHWMDGVPFYIAADNHEPLETGMVFHVPTCMRSFGRGGVGLSQTFVVEPEGARVLTHGDAELVDLSTR